jgi:hypothetical protein
VGYASSVAVVSADEPVGVRYAREVGPGDSGVRISLRRRYPDGQLGDVLGVLESWESGVVSVVRASGERVEIPEADVVATRRIPPPPVRRTRSDAPPPPTATAPP